MIKDKLNIVVPDSIDLGIMLGVSYERQNQIAEMLDVMTKKPKETSVVSAASVIEYIEERVDTKEEFFYAFINHMYYCLKSRRALSPELAEAYSKKYPTHTLKD